MNPFFGATRANLEQWRAEAQQQLAGGTSITGWNEGDAGATHSVQLSPERRVELILKELNRRWPNDYPARDVRRVHRTVQEFI